MGFDRDEEELLDSDPSESVDFYDLPSEGSELRDGREAGRDLRDGHGAGRDLRDGHETGRDGGGPNRSLVRARH